MKNHQEMISYSAALEILVNVANKLNMPSSEKIRLSESTGRILSDDIFSPINVPSFNNSAMDGFAIQCNLVNEAITKDGRIKVQVTGSIRAGDKAKKNLDQRIHLAWEIMTGAPMPDIFDAVIALENVIITESQNNKFIEIKESISKHNNIRKIGTDYQLNQLVADKGTVIKPQHIMALATVGIQKVNVLCKQKVAIITTGNELFNVKSGKLYSGAIFNSNKPFLKAYLNELNCEPVFIGSCKDDEKALNDLIDYSLLKEVKMIFSTGAVSMGKYDFIPTTLSKRGATIHFHKVKIRPGKPVLFAELANGTFYFGLPGNPLAAAACLRFFVTPFLSMISGLEYKNSIKAQLTSEINSKPGWRTFALAKASINEHGQLQVEVLNDHGSYQSRFFTQSNCWVVIPENTESVSAGELIEIVPINSNQVIS